MERHDMEMLTGMLQEKLEQILIKSENTLSDMSENSGYQPDLVDRASMETDRNLALLMRERDRAALREIKAALARVEEGEYGVCGECGEDIGVARLKAQPFATLCVECKTRLEEGRLVHAG